MSKAPRVGLILGSATDLKLVEKCRERLDAFGVPYEMIVASAHRTPDLVRRWTEGAAVRGLQTIVAAAGAAAALPGVVAAHTALPVIGLPLDTTPLRGEDSLLAIVQMPPGIPVATVGINNAENAALLAVAILALSDAELAVRLAAYREELKQKVEKANAALYQEHPGLRPAGFFEAQTTGGAPLSKTSVPRKRVIRRSDAARRILIDPIEPAAEVVEQTADTLLDGGIVALPTDTVYGLAADATNGEAVRKLYAIKGRSGEKAIPLFIPSPRSLHLIAAGVPAEIEALLRDFWPGPLTVVFKKYPGSFSEASPGDTIAIRIPDSPPALRILNEISRPLAVTSANLSGAEPALDAAAIERTLGGQVDLILDAGKLTPGPVSTVLDATSRPFRILRDGRISRAALAAVLGELLAPA